MKLYLLLLLMLFIGVSVQGVNPSSVDCRNDLLDYVKRMSAIRKPVGKKVYEMEYTVQYDYKSSSGQPDQSDRILIRMSSKKNFYESKSVQMYIDEKEAFLVVPPTRQIIWGTGNNSAIATDNFNYMSAFQDSLIRFSEIEGCSQHNEAGSSYKEIRLVPVEKLRNYLHVKNLEITFNETAGMIDKVVIKYDQNSELDQMVVNYSELNFDYHGPFKESARDKIFAKNKLQERYRDFELIDNRNNQKK